MKIIVFVSGLLLLLCSACDNKEDLNKELLIGKWRLQNTSNQVSSPTVIFKTTGEYEMMEFIKNPFNPTVINAGTITGDYISYDNKIEFITANVELKNDATAPSISSVSGHSFLYLYNNWNNDSIIYGKPFIISGYNPIIWTITELTENTLKAIKSPIDTVVYIKN